MEKSASAMRNKRRKFRHFHDAIFKNDLIEVKEFLDNDIDINFYYSGKSALQCAVSKDLAECCQLLIEYGANVDVTDEDGNTPLNVAAFEGYTEVARVLIKAGADVNIENEYHSTPINTAAFKGHADIVELLASSEECAIDRTNERGQTPLCVASINGHYEIVEILLKAKCDVEHPDSELKTALILAVERNHQQAFNLLLSEGFAIDCKDRYGCTALWHAAKQGNENIVRELIKAKANLDITDNRGYSPFMEAVLSGNISIVKLLADSGCDVNLKEHDNKQAALNLAVRLVTRFFMGNSSSAQSLVSLLLSFEGCDVNACDKSGWSPLYQAAYGGELGIVEQLLAKGADINLVTEYDETVLHAAALGNKPQVIQKLIDSGCDVNKVDRKNALALHVAAQHKSKIEVLEKLLEAGSATDVCEVDEGLTPIFIAIQQQYTEAVILLIKYNADVNKPNKEGDTPLWIACERGWEDIVWILLQHPDIDINRGVAHVPLHAATLRGHHKIVKMLLSAGCDVNKMTDLCTTAIYFAADADNADLAKLLIYFGANPEAPHLVKGLPRKCCRSYSDSHPHLELEPLQCAIRNNSFMMAMIILTGSPHMPYKVLNTLRDILFRTNYIQDAKLSSNMVYNYGKFFTTLLKYPRSLKDSCRGIIREKLGNRPFAKVDFLPLPTKIREYLCLQDSKLWAEFAA